MAVKKIFWEDPYLKTDYAKMTSMDGNVMTLDRTIFFAFSGGQAFDSGSINGYKVIQARKVEKEILYTVESNYDFKINDHVEVKIDWNKRYKIMRLHFAAEIILELMYQNFNDPKKIGANIIEDKARVDFEWGGNISETFSLLEQKARKIIDSNLAMTSEFSDEEQEMRYWQVDGFAKVACGGTHIRKTGEVGEILLKRGKRLGNNKERIEIYLEL